ncbi:hypothetical protein OPKNFCMD_2840 [Methylobacterium crusticola]|uniref:Peptidase n=1 Tax=Methylobacterium crusticola TaxID=1697972 RepID=A0ABQ4QXW4_9HYPH|nr:DUF1796 family putative cysteine peptidase [Methylobacterium crusticola]GJD50103.1 hypothetical protein OPKNFCMD_2840 [Methylobacterium crusticola]
MTAPGGPAGLGARLRRSLRALRGPREPGRVNHISLGSHCHMAHLLKVRGLRGWSGPFDWLFSSPGMVRDCLETDFARLLDRAEHESVPVAERLGPDITRCRHRYYRDRHAVPCVFNHHDPATSEADYRFLQEGVRRLRAALADPRARNRHYLLATFTVAPDDVRGICDALSRQPSWNHLTVLQVTAGAARTTARRVDLGRAALAFHDIHTRSPSLGLRFAEEADDAFVAELIRAEPESNPAQPG